MKNIKKILFLIISVSVIISGISDKCYAADSDSSSKHPLLDYVITSYDMEIDVFDDNICHITETITAYFNTPKHGIVRSIPLKQIITRPNGSNRSVRSKITDFYTSSAHSVEKTSGYYNIRLGNASQTVTGEVTYRFSYNYSLGSDPLPNIDEFYFNIIGGEWDTYIDNVTFQITMPHSFDAENIGFSTGSYGSEKYPDITYTNNGIVIEGKLNTELAPGNALTIRMELPEGYFTSVPSNNHFFVIAIPVILLLITFIMWFIWGRDEHIAKTVEVVAPCGLTSAQMGTIYHSRANEKEFVSIIVSLASKGYISIDTTSAGSGIFTDSSAFKITLLKDKLDAGDCNEEERLFLEGLVNIAQKNKTGNTIFSSALSGLTETKNKILNFLNSKENRDKFFEHTLFKSFLVVCFMIICYISITLPPLFEYYDITDDIIIAIAFPCVGIIATTLMCLSRMKPLIIFGIIWGSFFGGLPWGFLVVPAIIDYDGGTTYLIGIICMIIMGVFLALMPKRTHYGAVLYARICGYRDYLKLVEEDKIRLLVAQNPEYFYSVLPYAYVLDITDVWISKFEKLNLAPPSWCSSYVSSANFSSSIHLMFNNFQSASRSMSVSSGGGSGSGHSGGGHSGGGHGGGGGHSW